MIYQDVFSHMLYRHSIGNEYVNIGTGQAVVIHPSLIGTQIQPYGWLQ